jgi:hypothetical protein
LAGLPLGVHDRSSTQVGTVVGGGLVGDPDGPDVGLRVVGTADGVPVDGARVGAVEGSTTKSSFPLVMLEMSEIIGFHANTLSSMTPASTRPPSEATASSTAALSPAKVKRTLSGASVAAPSQSTTALLSVSSLKPLLANSSRSALTRRARSDTLAHVNPEIPTRRLDV